MAWLLYIDDEGTWRPVHAVGEREPLRYGTPGEAIDAAQASSYAAKTAQGGDGSIAVAPEGWDGSGAPEPGSGMVAQGVTS